MIRLVSAELFRIELKTRIPFRYGIATMTEVPQAILRVAFEIDGSVASGVAADVLPPKWFTKDPARQLADEVDEMLRVIRAAVARAREIRAASAFGFWRELYSAQSTWGAAQDLPPLLVHFGTSFVERALVHAVCRQRGLGFAAALQADVFDCDLGSLRPSLKGTRPRDWLPATPLESVFIRHTVGLSDPLDSGDMGPGDRVGDDLPQTLVENVRAYGLRHFKIKINGDATRDPERLAHLTRILSTECRDGYAFSLDGNESFADVGAFVDHARRLMSDPATKDLWPRLMYIEQPWHRSVALSPAMETLARLWPERPPIIIDESDGDLESLPTALALGYHGTSHKNCKGVFKGVANACLLAQRRGSGERVVLSGEDLANVGPVALIQDLAAQAALGVTSVERNGHHYFAGLAQFPAAMQAHALEAHPDLFVRSPAGWPRMQIRDGQIALDSVNAAPFGVPGEIDFSGMQREQLS